LNRKRNRLLWPSSPGKISPDEAGDTNELLAKLLAKAGVVFFYTCGKKEVHAWAFPQGADIVTCAGKIHSDLARGFIRAEIVNYGDLMKVHNMQEAKDHGLVKLVGKDYITQDGDIIEIKFNV
jgi:ribosome-binding ATPase YchF (GTP1/OBG family)